MEDKIEISIDWLVKQAEKEEALIQSKSKWWVLKFFSSKEDREKVKIENAISVGKIRMVKEILLTHISNNLKV